MEKYAHHCFTAALQAEVQAMEKVTVVKSTQISLLFMSGLLFQVFNIAREKDSE